MRAAFQDRYGAPEDVVGVREIAPPVVGDEQVLVRVRAASVNVDVWSAVAGMPYVLRMVCGWRRPRNPVPGTDLSGVVETVGSRVTRFKPGDEVFGLVSRFPNGGTYAEFAAVREDGLVLKPAGISFEQAATLPFSGCVALEVLQHARALRPGQRMLINGAGGAVGSIAVQVAKARGLYVTAVDAAPKLSLLKALGADQALDFTREDVTRREDRYDFVLDIPVTQPLSDWKRILTPAGLYCPLTHPQCGDHGPVFGTIPHFFRFIVRTPFDRHLPRITIKQATTLDSLGQLCSLIESGALTPVVGAVFALTEVPAAIATLTSGRVPGRVVIAP